MTKSLPYIHLVSHLLIFYKIGWNWPYKLMKEHVSAVKNFQLISVLLKYEIFSLKSKLKFNDQCSSLWLSYTLILTYMSPFVNSFTVFRLLTLRPIKIICTSALCLHIISLLFTSVKHHCSVAIILFIKYVQNSYISLYSFLSTKFLRFPLLLDFIFFLYFFI